jgi:serine/threonine protein kinase
MELASAVISLALVVKQQADDATENIALCHSLSSRAEMIPRLLEKFPDKANLDVALLSRIFEQLKSCHDLINLYRKKGALMRFIKAGTMKNDFQDLESNLGKSIDDLTLAVGVSSAIVLDSIRNDFQQFFQKFNNEHHMPPAKELEAATEVEAQIEVQVGSFFIAPSEVSFGDMMIHHSVPQLLPLRAREGVHREKSVFVREYLISTKGGDLPSLLADLAPVLDLLAQISHTESGAGCEVCPIIGWGYHTTPLSQASPSFPDTLVTLYLVSDPFPVTGETLTEFMKSHPTGLSGDRSAEELLLRISYSLVKNIAFLQYQCSVWESRGRHGETLKWAKGVCLLPRNLLINGAGDTMLLVFDSFLPLLPTSELASQPSFRREFFNRSPLTRLCLECAECDPREICIWCAPEQMKLNSLSDLTSATPASDIYAFGLILSYLSTGQLPHDPLSLQILDLKERVRQGRPQNTPRDGSLLSEVISYCVSSDPSSRPDAISLYRILLSLCQEKRIEVTPLQLSQHVHSALSPQDSKKLKAATSNDESSDDEGSECGLADFGDLADKVEQLSQAIKLFGSPSVSVTLNAASPVVVVYGSKVVLLNLPATSAQSSLDSSRKAIVDDEEEEPAVSGGISHQDKQKKHSGVVIFHIDNTASMKKDNRMKLVKEMLLAVVPKYLQLNYSIIVNSWSSTEETKGRIQVCRALNDLPPNLLEKEHRAEYESFMEETLFKPYLTPNGRTDLYGSCYQLIKQIEAELRATHLPVYSIVLTDGNHNRLDYPLHPPRAKGEEYFGVYKATLNNGTKFGLNPGATFDTKFADLFLKSHLDSLQALCGEINREQQMSTVSVSLVVIGIGEASTQSLSALSSTLGESCSFYGITRTEEVLPIFNSLTESAGVDDRVALRLASNDPASSPALSFRYILETNDRIVGCHVLGDQVAVEKLHTSPELTLSYKDQTIALPACPNLTSATRVVSSSPSQNPHHSPQAEEKNRRRLTEIVKELVAILSKLRAEPYEVTSETFTSVFMKLQADKKVVTSLKLLHSSKQLRNYRHLSIYLGLGVWIREMDDMVESQISAYRMNVETELLSQLGGDTSGTGKEGSTGTGAAFEPSDVVLERLQNNVCPPPSLSPSPAHSSPPLWTCSSETAVDQFTK